MPKFKAIFWDNDGTLVDTENLYFEASKKVLNEEGFDISWDFYVNDHLKNGSHTFQSIMDAGFSNEEIAKIRLRRNGYYSDLLENGIEIRPHVVEVLEKLHGETLMAIVTSSYKEHFKVIMEKSGLAKYFEFFVTQDDVVNCKPDPEPYLQALEKSGFKAEDCVAIEDTPKGIVAAKKAGLTAYAVPTDMTKDLDFSMADGVFDSVAEIFLPASSSASSEATA